VTLCDKTFFFSFRELSVSRVVLRPIYTHDYGKPFVWGAVWAIGKKHTAVAKKIKFRRKTKLKYEGGRKINLEGREKTILTR
jgi:hypothetical protein